MNIDQDNAVFELFGAILTLLHSRAILRDRRVAGVSILAVSGFAAWGIWNLFYYPSLDQWWSFSAGLLLCFANLLYLSLLVWFRYYGGPAR